MTKPYPEPTEDRGPAKEIAAGEFTHDLGAMLVESSPDALIALGADHAILFWSGGAEAIFGYTKEEAVGRTLCELVVPPELVEESRRATLEAIELGFSVY